MIDHNRFIPPFKIVYSPVTGLFLRPAAALLGVLALGFSMCAAAELESAQPKITASGMSSGGVMAQQLHLAYPEVYSGVGVIAAPAWGCSGGQLTQALVKCTKDGAQVTAVADSVQRAKTLAADGRVGDLSLLSDDRVWVFHGTLDAAVAREVSDAVPGFYAQWLGEQQLVYVNDVAAAHQFPTLDAGSGCDQFESPWLGACDYDAAGELLQHLHPDFSEPTNAAIDEHLMQQALPGGTAAGLNEQGWVYRPAACQGAQCPVHVVLHGCSQSDEQVGDAFVRQAGYLRWAERNGLVVAFPQVKAHALNPLGCWDWWGYTGPDFDQRAGAQLRVITQWAASLTYQRP